MDRLHGTVCIAVFIFIIAFSTGLQIDGRDEPNKQMIITSNSPFSTDLDTLQNQINYTFRHIGLLRRAMTHASFSQENNHALSILGASIIETSVSLHYLRDDIDLSSKTLNSRITEVSNVQSCALDGMHLRLHKVVRVSPKTNSTTPTVVCGAFRAIFGAAALDTGKSDDAGDMFWNVYTRRGEVALAM